MEEKVTAEDRMRLTDDSGSFIAVTNSSWRFVARAAVRGS